ncbi:MAG: Hpt domain-containing protein, partial [Actinomycetia bacterium]|nr:Hpt domain-containing protein [Actinomycetes bacterium]
MNLDENKFQQAFLEEADELAQHLIENLLNLEKDPLNSDVINEIFRMTHSIKSEAALVGFNVISEISHKMEDVFDKVRTDNIELNNQHIDYLFEASDLIKSKLEAIANSGSEDDSGLSDILEKLEIIVA